MKLTVHCVVKNEEKWVWFAINSILSLADKILIYDTGSADKTVPIIKSIRSKKIVFEERGAVNAAGLTSLRQEQLNKTKSDWFMILDGDEIWPQQTLSELEKCLQQVTKNKLGVVVRAWNFAGDLYHIHPESFKYQWPYAPKTWNGWANLRVIRKTPGMKVAGDYPLEAYVDNRGVPVQNHGPQKLIFLENRYLHTTYLIRSDTRQRDKSVLNRLKKDKHEIGIKVVPDFKYPKVLYNKRPSLVADPFYKRGALESLVSIGQSPIKEARRRLLGKYNPK